MDSSPIPDDTASPRGFRQRLLAILGLCLVIIMVALDQTVIGTALPTLVAELNGFGLYAWVGTAYLLTSIITIPIFGKLGDDHGRKSYVLTAIVLFTAASMLCGLAQSMLQLVAARALQGIGGGMLVATAFASVPDLFPETRERLRWQVMLSGAFGLANAFGPTLGGFLTEYLDWRWIFFVNLPVGIMSLWSVWRYLPRIRHTKHPPARLDWPGALLIALTLSCLQLLVEWLPQSKPPALLITLGLVGTTAGIMLFWWERRCANPILPLDMFSHRSLKPLFLLSLTTGFCMFAVLYYAPLMLQGGFGLSPNQAGLLITPLAVFITVGSIVNGRIVARLSPPNLMLYAGLGFFWFAALGLTQTTIDTPHVLMVAVMMLGGMGLGLLLPNITLFTQAAAARTQLGVATAMLQSTRMIGGMLGMALMGALVSHRYEREVHNMLRTTGDGDQWEHWLVDPEILLDPASAADFSTQMLRAGHDASTFLAGARIGLTDAIHSSQWVVVVFIACAFWIVHRMPPVDLHRPVIDQTTDAR